MRSNSGLVRISTALAVALALVPPLASGSAAAATGESTEVPPADRPIDVIDSDEIGDPVDRPIDVIDPDKIGDEGGSDSDEEIDVVDPELPIDNEENGHDGNPAEGRASGDPSEVSSDENGRSGGPSASVRDVTLARTGYPLLPLGLLGVSSLATGLRLLSRRRV